MSGPGDEFPDLIVERVGGRVLRLVLNRPRKLNALSLALLEQVGQRLSEASADEGVHCVIFEGAGDAFSAGADVGEFESLTSDPEREDYIQRSLAVLYAISDFPKPTVAAVHGPALGGGCELAIACDLVVAGSATRFSLPEAGLGVVPSFALTAGRRKVGRGPLAFLALTGRSVSAEEALRLGLVDLKEGGDPRPRALQLAEEIAAKVPTALFAIKELLRGEPGDVAAATSASVKALGSDGHRKAMEDLRRRKSARKLPDKNGGTDKTSGTRTETQNRNRTTT